jgi:putative exosortase-associated protein (TIGR04073 family)
VARSPDAVTERLTEKAKRRKNALYKLAADDSFTQTELTMRISLSFSIASAAVALLAVGCAGPEQKLGRGVVNITEFARMGEMMRSVEQTALWDGAQAGYTTGVIRGFNHSVRRTVIGAFEVATFPIPLFTYDPVLVRPPFYDAYKKPEAVVKPQYPDSYKPGLVADTLFSPDTALGFHGGDVMPFMPGSRFRIFDY